jgi:hypothetical protein
MGGISEFRMYVEPLGAAQVQHNYRILKDKFNLFNFNCPVNACVIDVCDFNTTLIPGLNYELIPNKDLLYGYIPLDNLNVTNIPNDDLIYGNIPANNINAADIPNDDLIYGNIPANNINAADIPNDDLIYQIVQN